MTLDSDFLGFTNEMDRGGNHEKTDVIQEQFTRSFFYAYLLSLSGNWHGLSVSNVKNASNKS